MVRMSGVERSELWEAGESQRSIADFRRAARSPLTARNLAHSGFASKRRKPMQPHGFPYVGDTGFEPVTPAVSRQCSAAELIALSGFGR